MLVFRGVEVFAQAGKPWKSSVYPRLWYCWWFRNPGITSWGWLVVEIPLFSKIFYIPGEQDFSHQHFGVVETSNLQRDELVNRGKEPRELGGTPSSPGAKKFQSEVQDDNSFFLEQEQTRKVRAHIHRKPNTNFLAALHFRKWCLGMIHHPISHSAKLRPLKLLGGQ